MSFEMSVICIDFYLIPLKHIVSVITAWAIVVSRPSQNLFQHHGFMVIFYTLQVC